MHGSTVIGDNELTAAHGSRQFANRKLSRGNKGLCLHLGNSSLHHLPVHGPAKKDGFIAFFLKGIGDSGKAFRCPAFCFNGTSDVKATRPVSGIARPLPKGSAFW